LGMQIISEQVGGDHASRRRFVMRLSYTAASRIRHLASLRRPCLPSRHFRKEALRHSAEQNSRRGEAKSSWFGYRKIPAAYLTRTIRLFQSEYVVLHWEWAASSSCATPYLPCTTLLVSRFFNKGKSHVKKTIGLVRRTRRADVGGLRQRVTRRSA
jgi:hypothetical protein